MGNTHTCHFCQYGGLEGWDANTVTHVLGVRAFGTQLLCEQVVGRALRRMSYAAAHQVNEVDGVRYEFRGFSPEYADVYGPSKTAYKDDAFAQFLSSLLYEDDGRPDDARIAREKSRGATPL